MIFLFGDCLESLFFVCSLPVTSHKRNIFLTEPMSQFDAFEQLKLRQGEEGGNDE